MKKTIGASLLAIALTVGVSACAPVVKLEGGAGADKPGSAAATQDQSSSPAQENPSANGGSSAQEESPRPSEQPGSSGNNNPGFAHTDAQLAAVLSGVKVDGQALRPLPISQIRSQVAQGNPSSPAGRVSPAECQSLLEANSASQKSEQARAAFGRAALAGGMVLGPKSMVMVQLIGPKPEDQQYFSMNSKQDMQESIAKCSNLTIETTAGQSAQAQLSLGTAPNVDAGSTLKMSMDVAGESMLLTVTTGQVNGVTIAVTAMNPAATASSEAAANRLVEDLAAKIKAGAPTT